MSSENRFEQQCLVVECPRRFRALPHQPCPMGRVLAREALWRALPASQHIRPVLDQVFRQRKRPVGASWRMDGTYISVKGQWQYIEPSTKRDTLLTSFSLPSGTAKQLPASSAKPSTSAVRRRKLPSPRAAPTRRRSKATMQHMKPASKSAKSSISIISSSRTTERSNE